MYSLQGRKKTQVRFPGQVNFALGQVKTKVWGVCWANKITLSSPVTDNFQPKTTSKLKTARCEKQGVESMD